MPVVCWTNTTGRPGFASNTWKVDPQISAEWAEAEPLMDPRMNCRYTRPNVALKKGGVTSRTKQFAFKASNCLEVFTHLRNLTSLDIILGTEELCLKPATKHLGHEDAAFFFGNLAPSANYTKTNVFAPLPHPLVASLRFRPSAFCEIPVLPGVSRGQIMVSMKLQRKRFKNAVQDPASLVYHPQDEQNMDPFGDKSEAFLGGLRF